MPKEKKIYSVTFPPALFELGFNKNIQPSFAFPPWYSDFYTLLIPAGIYLLKVNNRNSRK